MFVMFRVGSGLCEELITRSEESFRVCVCVCVCVCVIVCDIETETSIVRWPRSDLGNCATEEKIATVTSARFYWAPIRHQPSSLIVLLILSFISYSLSFFIISLFFSLFLNSFLYLILLIS